MLSAPPRRTCTAPSLSEPRLRLASQTAKAYDSSLAPQPSYVLYFIEAVVCLYASTRLGTSFDFDANRRRAGQGASGPHGWMRDYAITVRREECWFQEPNRATDFITGENLIFYL